ncbi:MAG: hypothetical protein U1F34_06215 [Gammaproteobacteria bacterium]
MGTTGLEEKMAANSQEVMRSLQAADAGITQAYATITASDKGASKEGASLQLYTGSGLTPSGACYSFRFIGETTPPTQGTGMDNTKKAWYFDTQSIGYNQVDTSGNCTGSANSFGAATTRTASSTVNGGLYQIAPEDPYVQPNST